MHGHKSRWPVACNDGRPLTDAHLQPRCGRAPHHPSVLPTVHACAHLCAECALTADPWLRKQYPQAIRCRDAPVDQFPLWSRMLCAMLPKRFTHLHNAMLGITLMPAMQEENGVDKCSGSCSSQNVLALFWGPMWLCKVQFTVTVGWVGFEKKWWRRCSGDAEHSTE